MNFQNLIEDLSYISQKDVPNKRSQQFHPRKQTAPSLLDLWKECKSTNILELLQPGSFVMFKNHPNDLPPFELISCSRGRCLVRQQTWGKYIHWEVDHQRLKSV